MSDPQPPRPTQVAERPPPPPAAAPGGPPDEVPHDEHAEDARLVRLVATARDHAALSALYERHAQFVNIRLRSAFPLLDGVADAAQQTWFKVWQRADTFTGGGFRPWVWRIAHNAAIDILRKQARRGGVEPLGDHDPADTPPGEADDEQIRALRECLQTALTGPEREVVERHLADNSYDEMLAAQGVTPEHPDYANARQRLYNRMNDAKKKLRACIERKPK